MDIVYISHLTDQISEGPNYSVPAQIQAQSKIDNVFWWNRTEAFQECWGKIQCFHGRDFNAKKLSELPEPFCHPDLVVFESFYYIDDVVVSWECRKRKIPFIVVPRSALTAAAQKRKRIKKIIGNTIFFNSMVRRAIAIQYLTEKEKADALKEWNSKDIVIPNGIFMPENDADHLFNNDKIIISYIGRFEPYQKGLDILLNAVKVIKDLLVEKNVTIKLYGPERMNCRQEYAEDIKRHGIESVMEVCDGVFGKEKEQVLLQTDIFIMVSRFEGLPMSMLEALSYGIPCIASAGTNLADAIQANHAGWGCKTDSISICDTLMQAIEEKEKFRQMSLNAIKLAKTYDWDEIAQTSHNAYCSLLK